MDGRLKQVSVGLVFVLSVSAVSGAVTYSQLRRGDDRPDKEEEKPKAAAAEKPARPFDVSGGAPVTDLKPESNPAGEFSIGQALGFGGGGGRDDDARRENGNGNGRGQGNGNGGGNHPGHGNGQGHDHHGNGHGYGHDHHDHDRPPVSPAHPGHHHGHGHDHHGNGNGHGHDHHDHD